MVMLLLIYISMHVYNLYHSTHVILFYKLQNTPVVDSVPDDILLDRPRFDSHSQRQTQSKQTIMHTSLLIDLT